MTHTAHAYVASMYILELNCVYACAYACAYLTSENQAPTKGFDILILMLMLMLMLASLLRTGPIS